ncbi:MAG: GtrA family protein [Hyphomicrobiales bacterium]|nr:GtrA family protein [Hyphomicrobiales bacterium]
MTDAFEHVFLRLSRFTLIGMAATVIYAACAFVLSDRITGIVPLPAAVASFSAYLMAGISSYVGHKYFTFASPRTHSIELPRFVLCNLVGLALAVIFPAVLTDMFDVPALVPIVILCVVVPALNFIVFDRWVFRHA